MRSRFPAKPPVARITERAESTKLRPRASSAVTAIRSFAPESVFGRATCVARVRVRTGIPSSSTRKSRWRMSSTPTGMPSPGRHSSTCRKPGWGSRTERLHPSPSSQRNASPERPMSSPSSEALPVLPRSRSSERKRRCSSRIASRSKADSSPARPFAAMIASLARRVFPPTCAAFSMTITCAPASRASIAAESPAAPAPMTSASQAKVPQPGPAQAAASAAPGRPGRAGRPRAAASALETSFLRVRGWCIVEGGSLSGRSRRETSLRTWLDLRQGTDRGKP